MNTKTAEIIQALTPVFLTITGAVIGLAVIFAPNDKLKDAQWAAAFGLSGTAISASAGLAQSGRNKNDDPS